MTPMIVHRYSLPLEDIVKAMIGPAECSKVDAVIVGENLIVELLDPTAGIHSITVPADFDHEKLQRLIEAGEFRPMLLEPGELPQRPQSVEIEEPPPSPPPRKGGPLATRAGILCNEGAFRLWAEVQTPDEAKEFIYRRCGVESRVDLDYEPEPAAKFRDMVAEYDAWLSTPD